MNKSLGKLPMLYQKTYELTNPECRKCRAPLSCCSPEYCEMAETIANEAGVKLERTDHPTLPYMGPTGCVVLPHLRPLCTLHLCSINGIGSSGDEAFDRDYFTLRHKIDAEEARVQRL